MPSSEAGPAARWRGILALAAVTLAAGLALVAGRVVWFDAYWLFREQPPWLARTHGASRLLDRQTRRAKILQAMTRDYTVALIGSSTVYYGLDPDDADPALRGRIFNAGISALMADELPVVAGVVASRRGVDRATIGLDYYMFSRRGGPAPLDPGLATPSGRWSALLGSAISRQALERSRLEDVEGGEDPGQWTYRGFRVTPPLPPALTLENDAVRRRTAAPYRPETLAFVRTALDALGQRRIVLYLSPVSDAQRKVLADHGLKEDFARWRSDVAALARARGVPFVDLVDLGAQFPFDPAHGSTGDWLDNLHYTPAIGRLVLEAIGLRLTGLAVP